MAEITERIFQGSGKSPIRKVGSGKAPRAVKFVGGVGNQSKCCQKKSPRKRG